MRSRVGAEQSSPPHPSRTATVPGGPPSCPVFPFPPAAQGLLIPPPLREGETHGRSPNAPGKVQTPWGTWPASSYGSPSGAKSWPARWPPRTFLHTSHRRRPGSAGGGPCEAACNPQSFGGTSPPLWRTGVPRPLFLFSFVVERSSGAQVSFFFSFLPRNDAQPLGGGRPARGRVLFFYFGGTGRVGATGMSFKAECAGIFATATRGHAWAGRGRGEERIAVHRPGSKTPLERSRPR